MTGFWMSLTGRESLIAPDDTWALLAVMCMGAFAAIWLEQKYSWASKISGCIIALVLAMLLSNLGIIPSSCVLYDDVVWGIVVPLGIPMLLLQCDLRKIWAETGRMLTIFIAGAAGTTVGAYAAYAVLKGSFADTSDLARAASMFTGTYIGGSVNLAAMSGQYAAGDDITAAAIVADNLTMAAYFVVLILFAGSRWMRSHFAHPLIEKAEKNPGAGNGVTQAAAFWGRKEISLKDIALNLAYASAVVWLSRLIAGVFASSDAAGIFMTFVSKFFGSQYVWITTISVVIATFMRSSVEKINGSQEIGTYCIYLFLFVIGAPASIYMVITKSPLLLVMTCIMVACNMLFCFFTARLLHFGLEESIIASNANIGGPTTAAGMAISQGWTELVGPAMLIGTLGYVLGNYLGTIVAVSLGL